jgi:hypothetical protein
VFYKDLTNQWLHCLKHSNQIQLSLLFACAVTELLLISFSLNTDWCLLTDDEGTAILSEALQSNTSLTSLNTGYIMEPQPEKIEKLINRNVMLWEEIHNCIRTNDIQQLTTLLSKHTINLNSFNLSTDGDTILHSASKSNDVKMIDFILQRISPSTKQRMLNMKNEQGQLPSDLVTVWTPSTHSLFPLIFKQVVKAVLMLGAKRQDGTPYYPQTHFYQLPKDLLFLILHYAVDNSLVPETNQYNV